MARVAWLSAETPASDGGGGQRRQYHQIRALLEHGIDVEVAILGSEQDASSISALARTVSVTIEKRFATRRQVGFRDTLGGRPFDAAIVSHIESVRVVLSELQQAGLPWLVDFQNVYSRWHARRGENREARMWRRRERSACEKASIAMACTDEERMALIGLGLPTPVMIAGNGVAIDEWPESALSPRRQPIVAFFGSLAHSPNRQGLEWFSSKVWPQIVSAVPESTFHVMGPGTLPVDLLALPRLHHLGRIPDLAHGLGRARVIVIPILDGMGGRVKFGESLASGAAVVSTSQGAEGYDARGAFVQADNAETFADVTIRLLMDEVEAERLGHAGRVLALGSYSWRQTTEPIVNWVESVTG